MFFFLFFSFKLNLLPRAWCHEKRVQSYELYSKPPNFGAANAEKNLFFLYADLSEYLLSLVLKPSIVVTKGY
jgi:hypothetical protein